MQFQFLTACVSSIIVRQSIIVFLQIITLLSSHQCNPSRPKPLIFFFKHQKMSSKPPDITADVPPSALDFRAYDDDAWYGVRLVLDGETLTVKFLDFGDESDKRLGPSDFEDPKALDDFAERFRPTAVQLQDGECRRVIEGKTVCASHTFGDNDVRFYDAVVETVYSSEHSFDKGEEQCLCEFVLFWQHGPIAGTKTLTSIENICVIQPGSAQKDPNLDFFLEISRKKLELSSDRSSFIAEHEISANAFAACFNETRGSAVNCEPNTPYKPQTFNSKEKKNPRQGHVTQTFKGYSNVWKKIGQDMDLGGGEYFFTKSLKETRNYHYILIENMETDLPPSVIVDFIYQQTSVSSHAYVTPSLLSESYTRGTIFLDGQEKLEKLSRFLHNPTHLIMSSRGRPWVIVEKEWRLGTFEGLMRQPEKKPLNKNEDHADKIKVVHKGTIEYEKGKQLSELFMEFCQHLQGLHKRLTLEERKILQSA